MSAPPPDKRAPRTSPTETLLIGALTILAVVILAGLFVGIRNRMAGAGGARPPEGPVAVAVNGPINATVQLITAAPYALPTRTPTPAPAGVSGPTATAPQPSATPSLTATVARPAVLLPGLSIPSTDPAGSAASGAAVPATDIPFQTVTPYPTEAAVDPFRAPGVGDDVLNVLLIGSDQRPADVYYRTDTILIVSINRTAQTVSMLSIPRDLYVNIPGHGLDRINTALEYGEIQRAGSGVSLLIQTIANATGITIQRYAKVDFNGFQQIIDTLGGVDVINDCPLSDTMPVSIFQSGPKPTMPGPSKYATLPVGVFHLDGSEALWYARSRKTTSDFDRARRQQIVLRAIYRKAFEGGLLDKLPGLWPQLSSIVTTDMTLGDVLGLLPLAPMIDGSRIRADVLGPPAVADSVTPEGAQVLIPQRAGIQAFIDRFRTPPTSNAVSTEKPTVTVWNASSHADWDEVAAVKVSAAGAQALLKGKWTDGPGKTMLYDYTGNAKPASLAALTRALALRPTQINAAPDPNAAEDFRLILGDDYVACTTRP